MVPSCNLKDSSGPWWHLLKIRDVVTGRQRLAVLSYFLPFVFFTAFVTVSLDPVIILGGFIPPF